MQTLSHPALGGGFSLEPKDMLKVSIAYENEACGQHAVRLYQHLAKTVGSGCDLSFNMWKIEELRNPRLRDVAAGQAAKADLVLVAVDGREKPALPLRSWIESWVDQAAGKDAVLVGLFDCPGEQHSGPDSARAYLHDVAVRGRMKYFWHSNASAALSCELFAEALAEHAWMTPSVLEDILHHTGAYPHWGINE